MTKKCIRIRRRRPDSASARPFRLDNWRRRVRRPFGADHVDHFGRRHDVGHAPAVGGADIHVFDEARNDSGVAEVFADANDFGLVDAAFDDGVDLDAKAQLGGMADVFEHFGGRKPHVVEALKNAFVKRVEADRDAVESGFAQRASLL